MKKIFAFIIIAGLCYACSKDDDSQENKPANPTEQTSNATEQDTDTTKNDSTLTPVQDSIPVAVSDTFAVSVVYNGSSVAVTGEIDSLSVVKNGAHLTITSNASRYMEITLSGSTTNGSLLVYSNKKYGLILNGTDITNANGPAINNQCGKSLYITIVAGTTNVLTDGTAYAEAAIDQKGTLFSEGQIYFNGSGTLTINGNAKNGIASDDYIVFESGSINVNVSATGTNGVKVNDGLEILGGTLGIIVKADGARGIKDDSYMTIVGGTTTITTSGDCLIETIEGVKDTTSCAGIKCDSIFTMTAGTLTVTSSGDGGKGINCAQNIELKGGTMTVSTTGSNEEGKPKAVKSDTGIVLSGGSFKATCKKSWACDNGIETENPAARVTIVGTPKTKTLEKRNMIVVF